MSEGPSKRKVQLQEFLSQIAEKVEKSGFHSQAQSNIYNQKQQQLINFAMRCKNEFGIKITPHNIAESSAQINTLANRAGVILENEKALIFVVALISVDEIIPFDISAVLVHFIESFYPIAEE